MKLKKSIKGSIILSILICLLVLPVGNYAKAEVTQDTETTISESVEAEPKIPNIIFVTPKKVDKNNIKVIFENVGIDTVDMVKATLIIWTETGSPISQRMVVSRLNPVIHQNRSFYYKNWRAAQVVDVSVTDGKDKDIPIKNSEKIYNN